jgi:hypothetical protein
MLRALSPPFPESACTSPSPSSKEASSARTLGRGGEADAIRC